MITAAERTNKARAWTAANSAGRPRTGPEGTLIARHVRDGGKRGESVRRQILIERKRQRQQLW